MQKAVVHIKELLKDYVGRTPKINKIFSEAGAAELWLTVIDPKFSDQTEAVTVKNGTLYVSVSNSVLAQELSLKRGELLSKINEILGQGEVLKDIRFRAGTIRRE